MRNNRRPQGPQSSQRSSGFHKPAGSGAAPETARHLHARHLASTQQPADSFCKEILPVQPRLEAPFFVALRQAARVAQCRGTTSRASPLQVRILPRAPFRPASIKVMQRTFNPLNRERYPGGPPFLLGGDCDSRSEQLRFGHPYCKAWEAQSHHVWPTPRNRGAPIWAISVGDEGDGIQNRARSTTVMNQGSNSTRTRNS